MRNNKYIVAREYDTCSSTMYMCAFHVFACTRNGLLFNYLFALHNYRSIARHLPQISYVLLTLSHHITKHRWSIHMMVKSCGIFESWLLSVVNTITWNSKQIILQCISQRDNISMYRGICTSWFAQSSLNLHKINSVVKLSSTFKARQCQQKHALLNLEWSMLSKGARRNFRIGKHNTDRARKF